MYTFSTREEAIKHAKSYGLRYAYSIRALADGTFVVAWEYREPPGC